LRVEPNEVVDQHDKPVREVVAEPVLLLGDAGGEEFRASGTAPVIRCYLEARTPKQMAAFRTAALELVQ
jgi:phosphomannomutase